ncbi:thiamine phosphate synthase [Acinetobacter sp. YH12117]|uniref:thiamine phosphate synthase n=1 Tax=Acinetobacter sp. YH12117 TaxID=2601104 RepID=UPI0015D2B59D|nr:thiamine phosphate synthase [Acinetobacter sp. YH12117]
MSKPHLHIAIGILLHQTQVLVGWREAKQHQGNKHEFPGGKVEQHETPVQACRREVREEVGIDLIQWHEFDFIRHEYEDVIVNLHVFHAFVPAALLSDIQQSWTWYKRQDLARLNFPQANQRMLQRLYWPECIKISEDLNCLDTPDTQQLLYWRVAPAPERSIELAEQNIGCLKSLIVNLELWKQLNSVQQVSVAAIHLKQQQCLQLHKGSLQAGQRYIAACHDLESLQHAQNIGCDAAILSPVLPTASHPDTPALGWAQFQNWAKQVDIPVFALGGMHRQDLAQAQQHHAYGIAGIRFMDALDSASD